MAAMARELLTYLAWLVVWINFLPAEGQRVQIHAEPSTIKIGHVQSLQVECIPNPASKIDRIFSMQIATKNQRQTKLLVDINEGDTVAKITDDELRKRATAQGNIDSRTITNSFLRLVINSDVSCSDADVYYCELTDSTPTNPISRSSINITANADPEVPKMQVTPVKSSFQVGDVVKFKCSGVTGNPPGYWTWDIKSSDAQKSIRHSQDTYKSDNTFSACKYSGVSVVTYTLKDGDTGKRFRCSLNGNTRYSAETAIEVFSKVTSGQNPQEPRVVNTCPGYISGTWMALIVPLTFIVAFFLGMFMPMIRRRLRHLCSVSRRREESRRNSEEAEHINTGNSGV